MSKSTIIDTDFSVRGGIFFFIAWQKPSFGGEPSYWIYFIELNRQVVEMLRSIQLCKDLPVGYFEKGTSWKNCRRLPRELHYNFLVD